MGTQMNMQLIKTNENCAACNRCISACPVLTSNNATVENGVAKVVVNEEACIHCGNCIRICNHKAREYQDDTLQFFSDLKVGKKISLLIAPAFIANYPKEYKKILGCLKSLGVNRLISVSFGADITTWGYLNYITKHNFIGGISQPCPAIVDYIEKYTPELVSKLVPIHSPMMCSAIYVKKYLKVSDRLAFLSPCIAKKSEISRPENSDYIQYNVTFDHLMDYLKKEKISATDETDELEYGLGSIYPTPGGLRENVEHFLGKNYMIRQIEGDAHAYHFLDEYKKRVASGKELPFMVDALNCAKGCLYGTGTEQSKADDEDVLFEIHKLLTSMGTKKVDKKSPWNTAHSYEERLKLFNDQFKELHLEDFICHYYTDRTLKLPEPTTVQLQETYEKMGKHTKEQRSINCSACGYNNCEEMAKAIIWGVNTPDNCIHFLKDTVLEEKEHMELLSNQIQEDSQKRQALYLTISEEFDQVRNAISELATGNNSSAQDAATMSEAIKNLLEFSYVLQTSLGNVKESIKGYDEMNESIIKISNQTNMLALNAGIEAARSGEAGKGFAVIADRVRELSAQTKSAVERSKEQSNDLIPALEELNNSTNTLLDTLSQMDEKTTQLAESSKEISANSTKIEEIIIRMADEMKEISETAITID